MPPKTRRTKSSKALKENESENVVKSKTIKGTVNNTKPLRKALADKTNSASDDNTSILIENVTKSSKSVAKFHNECENNNLRPRRIKKLPKRYNENVTSPSLSNNEENSSATTNIRKTAKVKTPEAKEEPVSVITPLKLPVCDLDNSLLKNRPKRICRLPSKFDDHSISPNKFIPVQPINASTPLTDKTKTVIKETVKRSKIPHTKTKPKSIFQKPLQSSKTVSTQNTIRNYLSKTPDTNNNAKQTKLNLKTSVRKSPATKTSMGILRKNISDNVKEKSLKRNSSNVDVYEFTYDPNDEPPPPKKQKKKVVRKPAKPKIFTVKNNYDKNLAKALATLKHTVATKSSPPKIMSKKPPIKTKTLLSDVANFNQNKNLNINESIIERNYNSVRLEDIAVDMQVEDDNIDYSPVNSPGQPKTSGNENIEKPPESNHQDISFFDELPAANSSMNSLRHPLSSPWRVEFNNLPIKWQVNTYVKPNMTPAFESSFMNFNVTKKKHVYANIVPEANVSLPQIVDSPNLKQTSIISFIKEVVEKSANKKKKIKSTPVKANSLFEDTTNTSIVTENSPKKQMKTTDNSITPTKNVLIENNSNNTSSGTDSVNVHNNDQNDKSFENNTYFGFDDTEDQENISPKKKNKARSLRARTRGILQELNSHRGPMRAVIPVIAKSKPINNTEGLKKIFDEVKSASEPPVFPEPSVNINNEVTVTEPTVPEILDGEDSQSVHLFEDIDVVHHQKPIRKSYGKPKRVAFRKNTMDSDTSLLSDVDQASSDDDLDDLSFKLPTEKPKKIIKKKKTKKQMLSKKEEKEVEAWAAGFNSMCEDIDEFDLVVE